MPAGQGVPLGMQTESPSERQQLSCVMPLRCDTTESVGF